MTSDNSNDNQNITIEILEKLRKKARNKSIILLVITFLPIIIITCISIKNDRGWEITFPLILLSPYFIIIIQEVINKKKIQYFKKSYNDYFFKLFAEELIKKTNHVEFNNNIGINLNTIDSAQLLNIGRATRFSSTNYILGFCNELKIEYSYVEVRNLEPRKDHADLEKTIFKGHWFVFDFEKKFKTDLQVYNKKIYQLKRNIFRRNLFEKYEEKYNKISIDDKEFKKKFKVYSQNPLDAFSILNPNIIENIKKINKKLKKDLLFCFVDSKLHIGIYDYDAFEASIFKEISENNKREKIVEEIKMIIDFVEVLNSDKTFFK